MNLEPSLRPFQEEDLPVLLAWQNDVEGVDLRLGRPFPVDRAAGVRWLQRAASQEAFPSQVTFALAVEGLPQAVGMVQLQEIHWLDRTAQAGILIADGELRQKGLGQRGLALLLGYAFLRLDLFRLWARIRQDNQPALALFQRAGFQPEGVLRQHAYRGGQRQDVAVMGLLRLEWEGTR